MKNEDKKMTKAEAIELLKAIYTTLEKGQTLETKENESTLDQDKERTVKDIVSDLKDPNMKADVDPDEIPAEKDSVMMQKSKKQRGLKSFWAYKSKKRLEKGKL